MKPLMLYYSKEHIDLDRIDAAQLEKLKQFKASIRDKGIQADFGTGTKASLLWHLTIVMRDMPVAPTVDARTGRAAKASVGDNELLPGRQQIPHSQRN